MNGPAGGKPGVIALRPIALGEIVEGAVNTMRRHAGLMLGAAAVVVAITEAIGLVIDRTMLAGIAPADLTDPAVTPREALELLGKVAPATGLTLAVALLAQTFLSGYLTVVVGKAVLGHPVTARAALADVRPRLLPLLGLTIAYAVLVLAAPVGATLLAVALGGGGGLLLLVAGMVAAVWLYVRLSLATPALVLERGTIGQALGRSQLLVRGAWWRTFGLLIVALLISLVVSLLIQIPFTAGTAGEAGRQLGLGGALVVTLGAVVGGTITYPFTSAVTALIYIDRRMRRENMQVELAKAAGTEPPR